MTSTLFRSGQALLSLGRAGLLEPGLALSMAGSFAFWGPTAAASYTAGAIRRPLRKAIIDDHGSINYLQLHSRTDRVAGALKHQGIDKRSTIAIMCRNHRGFIEANVAAAKLGARVVYLNTGLPPDQLAVIVDREKISLVVHDREFTEVVAASNVETAVAVAPEDNPDWSFPTLETNHRLLTPRGPLGASGPIILTSGTTGVPKGARRPAQSSDALGAVGVLAAMPYRTGDVAVIPAPLFHAWGLSRHLLIASFHGTVVLRRKFDPAQCLADASETKATALAVIPVMLRRMLDAESSVELRHVRVVASSGSALPGDLALRWMDRHGDNLYNLYGSTEVGQTTIAGPADLRAAPGTAGRPPLGVEVSILGPDDQPVPPGEIGDIVVGGSFQFDGYTAGGTKGLRAGAMPTGDTGYLDPDGRLFVSGRADDMIISGGENLYPRHIEEVLLELPTVSEAAVVGVADDELGQLVRAVVVKAPGAKVTKAALKKHAKAHLATYEVPREFVFADELPRNTTGKILRNQLSE